jgi:hypothetical protein
MRGLKGGSGNNKLIMRPIASARTVEQVEEIIQVVELSGEEVEKLNGVSV